MTEYAIPMLLYCPECGQRHVDAGEYATKVHHTHSCQGCGMTWRPAVVATVGVRFLPGFRDEPEEAPLDDALFDPASGKLDPVGPVRTVHVVKSAPTPFQAVWDGLKRFEIRRNDRDYREGDALRLREWDANLVKTTGLPNAELYGYTGREARARIIHYSVYEQKEGYCVLGLGEVARSEPDNKGERR